AAPAAVMVSWAACELPTGSAATLIVTARSAGALPLVLLSTTQGASAAAVQLTVPLPELRIATIPAAGFGPPLGYRKDRKSGAASRPGTGVGGVLLMVSVIDASPTAPLESVARSVMVCAPAARVAIVKARPVPSRVPSALQRRLLSGRVPSSKSLTLPSS